jgi:hypothetical protein
MKKSHNRFTRLDKHILLTMILLLVSCTHIYYQAPLRSTIRRERLPIPEKLREYVKLVTIDSIRIAIFDPSYHVNAYIRDDKEIFINPQNRYSPRPDLILSIDNKILKQIYRADSIFMEHSFDDPSVFGKRLSGIERDSERQRELGWFKEQAKQQTGWDRQYFGFFNKDHERMVWVSFVDIRYAPDRLGFDQSFYEDINFGCCDGDIPFYVDRKIYNIDTDSLSVN